MSTINFPNSPTLNDEFTFEGRTWVYNGSGWRAKTGVLGVATTTTDGLMAAADKVKLNAAVVSDTTGITGADAVVNIVSLTQAEYDAIVAPDAATLYVIVN
jgi:hypothetical protein